MASLREIFANFKVKFELTEVNKGIKAIKKGIQATKDFAAELDKALHLSEIRDFIMETVDMADKMTKTAQQLGITTREFGGLQFAASQAGLTMEEVSAGFAQFSKNIVDAATKGGEIATFFRRMNIETRTSTGEVRNMTDVFRDFADRIQGSDSRIENVANAMQAFGESGRRLLPLLNAGSEEITRLQQEFEEYGGGLTMITEQSEEFKNAMGRLNLVFLSFRSRILVHVLPILNKLIDAYAKSQKWTLELIDTSRIMETTLIVLGAVAAATAIKFIAAWVSAAWPFLLAAAAIGIVILVIDDLIVAFEGGESATGRFFDSMMMALNSTKRWEDFVPWFNNELSETWKWLVDIAKVIGVAFQGLFGGEDIDFMGQTRTFRDTARFFRRAQRNIFGGEGQILEDESSLRRRQRARETRQNRANQAEDQLAQMQAFLGIPEEATAPAGRRGRRATSIPTPTTVTVPAQQQQQQPVNVNNTFQPNFNVQGITEPQLEQRIRTAVQQEMERENRQLLADLPDELQ